MTEDLMEELFPLLEEELKLMDKASEILNYSYDKCKKIGIKDNYDFDELDRFESLTSRFARLSDLLIQKIFRLIDKIDLEMEGTTRDRINRAERKELIKSADDFIKIRILRNEIAHEYVPEDVQKLFEKVLKYTPVILDSVKRVEVYCKKYTNDEASPGNERE